MIDAQWIEEAFKTFFVETLKGNFLTVLKSEKLTSLGNAACEQSERF